MRLNSWLAKKQIAGCLATLLSAAIAGAATPRTQDGVPTQQDQKRNATPAGGQGRTSDTGAGKSDSAQRQVTSSSGQAQSAPSSQDQRHSDAANPVGTAAAPLKPTMGVAASRPAGAVIAPAKQRRIRAFVIGISVVVGAGVALGTVAALSHSTSSQPR